MRVPQLRVAVIAATLVTGLAAAPSVAATNPEGQPDTTYGGGDGVVTHVLGTETSPTAMAMLPDGRVVIAAQVYGVGTESVVIRLTATGALDTTFGGGDAVAVLPVVGASPRGIAVGPDGRIVVAGSLAGDVPFVARLTAAGAVDTTFDTDGAATYPLTYGATFDDVAIAPDGRIVAAGSLLPPGGNAALAVRLTGTGALDPTFDTDGWSTEPALGNTSGKAVAVRPDGSLVLAVSVDDGSVTINQIGLVAFTAGGAPDTSFGTDNLFRTDLGGEVRPHDVVVQEDGGIVLGGYTIQGGLILARVDAGGDVDTTFGGGDGLVVGGSGTGFYPNLALEPNGRIVVASTSASGVVFSRFLSIGVPDTGFGVDGARQLSTGTGGDSAVGVGITAGGAITAITTTQDTVAKLTAMRVVGDKTKPFGATVFAGSRFVTSTSRSVRWTASDDNTGIRNFDVRFRSAAYSSSTLGSVTAWKTNTTATSATLAGSAGRTYCIDARADDNAGNTSPYSPVACIAFPVNDRSLTRSGSWTSVSSSGFYRGTASRSTSSGAKLTRTGVRYRQLAVIATTCSGCGKVAVYLGSTKLATLDLSSSTTKRKRVFLVDTSATVKSGTVVIKQISGGKPVIIEGLGVSLY